MPSAALIATKLTPPEVPARFVSRARLVDRLESALDDRRALLLVSAPAGSGKSTLLAGWLHERRVDVAWLQIDESDADPARFWAYVGASLDTVVPGASDRLVDALAAGPDAAVTAVIDVVGGTVDPVVLVLDDYHLIGNPDVHAGVERLVELRPPNLTVVVSTRVDPPFRLGRLRVRGQVTEVRSADLRFEAGEAATLLGDRGDALDDAAIDRLCSRTEGWAAGLVLAGLSLRLADDADAFVQTFNGDDQLIADYLSDELLDALDASDRRRLLDVAVLDRMSGPLVDAVCGTDDGDAWLRATAADNQLLIALDRTGTWFRFHHLLRDLLRLEARRTDPDRLRGRHAAAGRWHLDAGNLESAIEHLLAADELVEAADLIADNATHLLNRGQTYTVNRYLDRLGDVAERHGGVAIVRGWISFVSGRFSEADRWLGLARELDVDGVDAGLISSLSIMIHVAEGDVAGALELAATSPDPTEPTHSMVLGGVRVWGGRFDDARPHLARANQMAADRPDHFTAAVTPVFEAVAEIELGNAARARDLADASVAYAADHRLAELPQIALAHSVIARTSAGDPGTAADAARRGVRLARRSPEHIMLTYALASAADVLCEHGDPDGPELLAEARTIVDRCPDPGVAGRYLDRVEARHGRAAPAAPTGELVEELTDRELAVLRYLPTGLSQREIAGQLYVSLNTVKTHCKAIYRKLGVDGRKPAVQAARDLGLL